MQGGALGFGVAGAVGRRVQGPGAPDKGGARGSWRVRYGRKAGDLGGDAAWMLCCGEERPVRWGRGVSKTGDARSVARGPSAERGGEREGVRRAGASVVRASWARREGVRGAGLSGTRRW
jgi:hypothetical protein